MIVMIMIVIPAAHIVTIVVAVIVPAAVVIVIAVMAVAVPVRTSDTRQCEAWREHKSSASAQCSPVRFHEGQPLAASLSPIELRLKGRQEADKLPVNLHASTFVL